MAHINPTLPNDGDSGWGDTLNTAIQTIIGQANSADDAIAALPTTYAPIGSGGGGGGTGLTATDNGDGTTSLNSTSSGYFPSTRATSATAITLLITDANNIIQNSGTGQLVVTVPTYASVPFPIGTVIELFNYSSGTMLISGASGVTLRSPAGFRIPVQYASAALRKLNTDEWVLVGFTSI